MPARPVARVPSAAIDDRARALRALVGLIRRRCFGTEAQRLQAGYAILERVAARALPGYLLTDFSKTWSEDAEFLAAFYRLEENPVSAERKFFLRELMKLVAELEGDTAEAGVYRGAASWFICDARRGRGSTHWAFDSFEGLPEPRADDGGYWRPGEYAVGVQAATETLAEFDVAIRQGWIPEVFTGAEIDALVFAHIDVDLYEPTLASIEFFYPQIVPGGVIVCDDYGYSTCPGATRALDEYMAGRPEPIIHRTSGQGVIVKR
jgi:hypothetical protein